MRAEFNDDELRFMERSLSKIEREANGLVDLIVETTGNKSLQKRYEEKLSLLELQKADLETELSKLRVAYSIRLEHDQIVAWPKSVWRGDPLDIEFQRKIIDTFVNSVYIYDDKIMIIYNVRGGKQVSYIDVEDALKGEFDGENENQEGNLPAGKRFDNKTPSPTRKKHA